MLITGGWAFTTTDAGESATWVELASAELYTPAASGGGIVLVPVPPTVLPLPPPVLTVTSSTATSITVTLTDYTGSGVDVLTFASTTAPNAHAVVSCGPTATLPARMVPLPSGKAVTGLA